MKTATISRLAKERFLLKLSEDSFRDEVVRPLLLSRGYLDGRDLCGPTEQGKDAIFYEYDKLGILHLVAIQTKKGSANLAAKAASNIVDLTAQLRTAAQATYAILKPVRMKKKVAQVILIVSGKINDSARRHLVDEVNDSHLQFLDVDDLIPWIDESLPQLWLAINSSVSSYFSAIEKQLMGGVGPFAQQFLPENKRISNACLDNSSVAIKVTKASGPLEKSKAANKKKTETVFPLYAIHQKESRKVLLLGEGGAGKTVGLLQCVYRAAKQGLENERIDAIPLLVKASDIIASGSPDLTLFLEENSRLVSQQTKAVFTLGDLASGKICVFIDGLDEVGEASARERVCDLAVAFIDRFPSSTLVITSRPYEYLSEIQSLGDFERYSIIPIDWDDASKIFDLVRHGKKFTEDRTKESLAMLSKVAGFSLNPLMISIFAATSVFDLHDIPPNITELFKRFTEQMLGRWDEQRGLKLLHRPLVKDFALSALAFEMHSRRITKIFKSDAIAVIRSKLAETGHSEDADAVLEEIELRSGIFRVFGDEIGFRHHMFQEFFAGRAINKRTTIERYASDPWWRRAIVFYFGEYPKTASDVDGLFNHIESKSESERFATACTIGLALQACYLSPIADKVEAWKKMVSCFSHLRPQSGSAYDQIGVAPNISMFAFSLTIRDSLALSCIAGFEQHLRNWAQTKSHEERIWVFALVIIGLMRIGRFDLVSSDDISALASTPGHALLTLVELTEGELVRPLSTTQKERATELGKVLHPSIKRMTKILVSEMEAQVEMRKLAVEAISHRTMEQRRGEG